jgi:cyclopropane-fatty-acyl-phospholipid synthase
MNTAEDVVSIPAGVRLRDRLATRIVLAALARWPRGALTLALPDGRVRTFGDPGAEHVFVTIKDWKVFTRLLTASDIGAGEAYMNGEFTTNDLVALCRVFLRQPEAMERRSLWGIPARLTHHWQRRAHANTLAGSRRNITYHYDLSNDFYRLFLDPSMMYSCAEFDGENDTLEAAQERKLDGICRRLGLTPGLQVLEIGSGWGAFAIHAARHYGCQVVSLTLSHEQLALARERVAAAGVSDRVDIRLCDYRHIEGCFDRIVSIEMFEAVGYEYYGAFFGACARALRADGQMFLQTIAIPDQRFDRYRRELDFIKKYIFPGGLLASLHAITAALKRHTDLRIEWMRDIGLQYAPTLRCWRERFLSQLPAVRQLGFDERFIRMWEFYLASCEAAFSVRHIGDLQVVLSKPETGAA